MIGCKMRLIDIQRRELILFLIVGIITVLIDFSIYYILLSSKLFHLDFSKALGFFCGTLFAYFANKHWTFSYTHKKKMNILKFYMLYSITLGVNVITNAVSIDFLYPLVSYALQISFVIATGFSAALNFLGMKFFVFSTPQK